MFFKIKSEPTQEVNETNYCFFIPVVEQLKPSDYVITRAWNFAKSPNTLRKFYMSTQLLQQSEAPRLPEEAVLSCYKVILTADQMKLLNQHQEDIFKGFIPVMAAQIESMVIFSTNGIHIELNPFYEHPAKMNEENNANVFA